VVPGSTEATFGGSEIGCIAVYPKDHVTGMVMDSGIRMSGAIIEELHDGFYSCLGTFGLLVAMVPNAVRRVLSTALALYRRTPTTS